MRWSIIDNQPFFNHAYFCSARRIYPCRVTALNSSSKLAKIKFCTLLHVNNMICIHLEVTFDKGLLIYDVHKKITFLTPSPHASTWAGPPPPLWTSTHGQLEIHTALL